MLTLVVAGVVIGCSSEPAAPTTTPVPVVPQIVPVSQFLAQPNPKDCSYCYLADADLIGAKLTDAWLMGATLTGANLGCSRIDGVIGADFTGALNVRAKCLKD